jgi:nitroreductase
MKETQFLDALKWRYAVKKMSGKEIPAEKLDAILEAIRLTPSSFGFTPYSVVVVQDKEIQAKLLPHCYNQSQIVDASALLVFAPWKNIHADQVDVYMKEIAEARNIPVESLNDFANAIKGKINHSSNEDLLQQQ